MGKGLVSCSDLESAGLLALLAVLCYLLTGSCVGAVVKLYFSFTERGGKQ